MTVPAGRRTPGPTPKAKATKAPKPFLNNHLRHIKEHFARLRQGYATVADPEAVFLGHQEGDFFWELIGMRLRGHPAPILGAVRFRRHEFPGVAFARESLAAYLRQPCDQPGSSAHRNAHVGIAVLLPRAGEQISAFLRGLRAGRISKMVQLDPSLIDVAFDFRMHNPYGLEALKRKASPLERRLFRTAHGHILSGFSHDPRDAVVPEEFVAIREPVQHSARGSVPLPALAMRSQFVALTVDVSDEATRLAARHWVPFSPASAATRHLLLA